jgi:hypothetical protein
LSATRKKNAIRARRLFVIQPFVYIYFRAAINLSKVLVTTARVYQPVIYKIAAGLRWNVEAAFLCGFRNKNRTRRSRGVDRIVYMVLLFLRLVISSQPTQSRLAERLSQSLFPRSETRE